MRLILILCLFLTNCTWSMQDKALFSAYTVGNIIDIGQTRAVLSDDEYYEINPLLDGLNKDQATAVMLGTNLGLYFLSDYFEEWRTYILLGAVGVKWGLVIHNNKIGVEMEW